MVAKLTKDEERKRQQLAAALDMFTEEEACLLSDATPSTVESWRKRRTGPPVVRFGKVYLYPKAGMRKWLESRVREGTTIPGKSVL